MKKIATTALSTFGSLFLLFSYGIGMFGFLFPGTMVGFCIDLGLPGAAAMFQERVYRRNPTAENMYMALDRNIHAKRHERVIYFSEKFFLHHDMQQVIDQVNKFMLDSAPPHLYSDEERAFVANQLSRLRSAYVYSLLAVGEYNRVVDFLNYKALDVDLKQPCYAYFTLLGNNSSNITQTQRTKIREDFIGYFNRFEEAYKATVDTGLIPRTFIDFVSDYIKFVGG